MPDTAISVAPFPAALVGNESIPFSQAGVKGHTTPEQLKSYVGAGVAPGGTTGQLLAKVDNSDYSTHWVLPPRELLLSPRTYYVDLTGNDLNNGLTVSTAFATFAKALDVVSKLDATLFRMTIRLAPGAYAGPIFYYGMKGTLNIIGSSGNPADVTFAGDYHVAQDSSYINYTNYCRQN